MTWPSKEGWSHGVKFLFVQGGAEGTDELVLVMAHDALSCVTRERVTSVEEKLDGERVAETMRTIRHEL